MISKYFVSKKKTEMRKRNLPVPLGHFRWLGVVVAVVKGSSKYLKIYFSKKNEMNKR
jgi:hypothetical protein